MIEKAQNKQITKESVKVKQTFFFPGGGEFIPQNIEAENYDKAVEEYEKTREKYNK